MPTPISTATRLFHNASRRFLQLSRTGRIAVVAAIVVPLFTLAAISGESDDAAVPASVAATDP